MTNPLPALLAKVPQGVSRPLLVRVVLFSVFAASAGLVWWSVDRLAPLDKKLEQLNTKLAGLENEIQHLELNPNPLLVEQMAAKFRQVEEELFASHDEAIEWPELKRSPSRFVLKAEAQVGRTQACPLAGKQFSIVSANLDLQSTPSAASASSPYKQVLEFAQTLTTQKKRVDLVELTVSGNSNSVSVAKMGLQLWAQENRP